MNHHFELVTAGHHFLFDVLPFREPESRCALDTFVAIAAHSELRFSEVDAVLLRCLSVLNAHTGGRLPSLVDRYLASDDTAAPGVARFAACLTDVLRFLGIGDPLLQHAIRILNVRSGDPALTRQSVAAEIGVREARLSVAFKQRIGVTFTEYLRGLRLDRAARLLVSTDKSVKEVWATIGYNHPSNFDHDFKRRFSLTPRAYRLRGIVRPGWNGQPESRLDGSTVASAVSSRRILIVDDDELTRAMIGGYLAHRGYEVSTRSSGGEGLTEAARFQPDLVLVDYWLGDIDGLSFVRTLRARSTERHPAVAILSADLNLVNRQNELAALRALFVSKLCDLDHIGDTVTYLLARERTREPVAQLSC